MVGLFVLLAAVAVWGFSQSKKYQDRYVKLEKRRVELEVENAKIEAVFAQMEAKAAEDKASILELSQRNSELEVENASLRSDMDNQKQYMDERYKELEKNKEALLLQFKDISGEIIKIQTEQFNAAQKKSLSDLLEPFKAQISDFRAKVENVHEDNIASKSRLDEQFKNLFNLNKALSKDAQDLSAALKGNKKIVGDWGELQLSRALELSGLEEGIDFELQSNFKGEENNNLRPDAIVSLPQGRNVIIDAKVSLNDYVKYANAEDEESKDKYLKSHIKCLKNHIDELSSKEYQKLLKGVSLDYVIIFVPIESAYIDAVRKDNSLYEYAYKKNIAIATPSSILAILRTVESIWRIEKQSRNVQEIARVGGSLYDKIANFVLDMERLGASITAASKNYNEAMNKLKDGRGSALSLTKTLKTLGAKTTKEIAVVTDDEES
jgi:DNA recombination protein RmuC